MQTVGSISLSLGTSIQVISVAPGSPGEHGVRRSSTMAPGVVREGPRTCTEPGARGTAELGAGDSSCRAHPGPPWAVAAPTHLLEVCGRLHLAHGLHQGVPHDDADVGPRVAVSLAGELLDVGIRQGVRGVPQVQPEHLGPRHLLGQGDVDPLLKPGGMRSEPQFQPCWGAGTGGCVWGSPSPDG